MASDSAWHPLPAFPDLPPLLISPKFAASSYTLHITDLANVWVEKLDRKGILLRSLQEDTSIDLSDGDSKQWDVFLSKLNAAFDPTSPEHHSTRLSLTASPPDKASEGGIALHVICVLPEPLKPLRWPVYLTKCPPVGLASEVVLPLIQSQHERNMEAKDLMSRLQEKDAVIARLIDKLEAMHTGLEHVFNSLSGKRKPSRATAEEKVKGLAAFNESDWRTTRNASRELPRDVPSLIHEVFSESEIQCNAATELGASSQLSDWWTKLDSKQITAVKSRDGTPKRAVVSSPRGARVTEERDDDFQVQATPPHLQSKGRTISHSKAANDSTEDDDSSAEIPDSHLAPVPAHEKPRARLGGIGGQKAANKENSASQSSHTIPANSDETASESDGEAEKPKSPRRSNDRLGTIGRSKEPSPPPEKSRSPAPPPSKDDDETVSGSDGSEPRESPSRSSPGPTSRKKAGLGRIGGKPKPQTTPEPAETSRAAAPHSDSPKGTSSPAKPAGRKLGIIGKKPEPEGKRPRSESGSPEQAVEAETEEQRTERRRAELAKELQRKAAAPTKKKRRF
ncbi:XLF-domain-containing protein [Hypoxylon sp. FL1284]|nr:XLF-domain-containing protein [Hypoxylon sp. FL1284]